jgi:hypothetical protein
MIDLSPARPPRRLRHQRTMDAHSMSATVPNFFRNMSLPPFLEIFIILHSFSRNDSKETIKIV